MSRHSVSLTSALLTVVALGVGATAGQQPRIINGRVVPQTAPSNLMQTFRSLVAAQNDVAWIGYSVPIRGEHNMCCFDNGNGVTYVSGGRGCNIEPAADKSRIPPPAGSRTEAGTVKLEGSQRMSVMFRVVDRQVERIRTFSEECELDAGGRQVNWLQDVRPAESVALLESLVGSDQERKNRVTNGAISAIAMHADSTAAPAVIRLARDHASPAVRGDALFWVAQLASQKAVGTITEAIEKDPDTDVKRRAVFALSQLPKSEGVPLLIDVAKKNRNAAVRKQAMFWLGQSRDPRATEFFAEILK
jgi:hypothetical protein